MPIRMPFTPLAGSIASLVLGGAVLTAAGCATSDAASGGGTASAAAPAAGDGTVATGQLSDREWIARNYLTTPEDAARLGYRIDWQHQGDPGTAITEVQAFGQSVFAIDDLMRISRYDGRTGTRLWRVPMLENVSRTQGMVYLPADDALFVGTGSEFHVYDGGTGVLVDRQKLDRAANTAPTPAGRFLMYGSRDGLVVWHAFQVGAAWRSYRIAESISVAPAISEGFLVAAGNGGTISCLRLGDASRVWTRRALADIVAAPAAGNGMAYVASLDQHLRAWPLSFERPTPAWEFLAKAPLTDSPTILGDSVYQPVPGHGLHRFAAAPANRPDGLLEWVSPQAGGSVAARLADRLLIWDADRSVMQVVDERTGDLIDSVELPRVDSVHVTDLEGGAILLGGTGGRVLRLTPIAG